MEKIINLIENKNLDEILNYSKSLTDDERFSIIIFLKKIDIDNDILKKVGSNLTGKARNDFYENRKQISDSLNYFRLTCVRNYEDIKLLEIKHEYGTHNPFYRFFSSNNFDHIIAYYKLFPPNYFNKLIKDISQNRFRNINFKFLWKIYEKKWIEFDEAFFVHSMFNLNDFESEYNHFNDSNFLISNPIAIEKVFNKFYKYEIPILDLIKAESIDYSNGLSAKANVYWTEVFKILIKEDKIKDRKIVTNLLQSLLNNWKKPHLDWHVRLLELFQPTEDELIENQYTLFSILGTGQPSLINYAIRNIKNIIKNNQFDNVAFLNHLPIIFSNEKAVKSILEALNMIELMISDAKIQLEYREQIAVLLMQSEVKIQEKTAIILIKYFNDDDLIGVVSPYNSYLKQSTRDIFKLDAVAYENKDSSIHSEKTHKPIEPIKNWDELLFHIGTCIRTKSAQDIETFFEGLILLQSEIPADFEKQLKPYTKQLFNRYWESTTMQIFSQIIECWIKKIGRRFIEEYHNNTPFLAKKAQLLLHKLKTKNFLPFLSSPTHEPFYVHPNVLIDRIVRYEETNTIIDLEDLIVACNRTIISELQNDIYKEKIKTIKGYYSDALNYFFGMTNKINFTEVTLPLWTQICRIKNPSGVFHEFENSSASVYPSVIKPFFVDFKIEVDAGRYVTFYRLLLKNNWNYSCYDRENAINFEPIYHNTASSDKANRIDIAYQFSINPNYLDALLCRYIPDTATGNEVDGFEDCLYPMQFILENQITIFHSGWIYVAVCLLFEKKISRDLASEYIQLAISRNENLDYLAIVLGKLINKKYAPVNRFIEYLDKPIYSKEIKAFQFNVLVQCIIDFEKENLPINSKKIIQYYKDFKMTLNIDNEEVNVKILALQK